MIPWMKEQIADVWHNRKGSRTTKKGSLVSSTNNDRGIAGRKNDNSTMSPSTSSGSFNVNIISLDGDVLDVLVKPDFTIEKLKIIAMKHFYGSDTTKTSSKYHLVHADTHKLLAESSILFDEDVNASDELLMIESHPLPIEDSPIEDAQVRIPTQEAILTATNHLLEPQSTKTTPTTDCPADFQAEIRKILITLVQASAKLLMHSPDAVKVYEIIREKLEMECKPPYDPKTVKYLMDIGFAEKKVLKALRLRKMNVSEALEWLIEHQDDLDGDEEDFELPPLNIELNNDNPGPSSSSGAPKRKKSVKEACLEIFKAGPRQGTKREPNLVNVVNLLLESFNQYKRLEFKLSPRIKKSLIEMGFEEKNVIEALKITGNNQSNACEWLLGARRKSLQDLDEGLNEDSPIYAAIMSNPHIQLSLTNPKMLLAYLSILETPSSTSIWINNPEVSPVLSQIFKTYHSEKHAIHMNRYDIS